MRLMEPTSGGGHHPPPTAKAEEAGRRTGSPDSEAHLQLVIPPWADAAYVVEVAQPTHWVGAGQRGGETEYEVYPARKRGRGEHTYYISLEWRPLARGEHLKNYAHMILLKAGSTPNGSGRTGDALMAENENADQPGYIVVRVKPRRKPGSESGLPLPISPPLPPPSHPHPLLTPIFKPQPQHGG
jgi:hypothetical protein